MTTLSRTTRTVSENYTNRPFQIFIEDHLSYLKLKATTVSVGDSRANKFKSNFYGLLREMKVDPKYWWVYLRLNDYKSPLDYSGALAIKQVSVSVLEKLYLQQRTTVGELF